MIQENISLKQYNTFGIDIKSKYFIEVSTVDEIKNIYASNIGKKILIIGGGSNILFTKDFDGMVLKNAIKGIELLDGNSEYSLVKAYAGEPWHEFVLWTLTNNLGGIENLSLIPGCVGAAPMQNIGAYGVELKDVFISLEAFNIDTLEIETFDKESCDFGYRESVFKNSYKNKYVILSITIKLSKKPIIKSTYGAIEDELKKMGLTAPSIQDISKAVIRIRQSKLPDPKKLGNSGSFFKNPVISKSAFVEFQKEFPNAPYYQTDDLYKIPAGWLIEQCGWKGKVVGNTGAHAHQALVLVNYGNASGNEVWELAQKIQQSVFDEFNIEIETEVNVY